MVSRIIAATWRWKIITASFLALLFLVSVVLISNAAVVLVYFYALSEDYQVRLQWKTASELDTAGFNVFRSFEEGTSWAKINATIILATADDLLGGQYEYVDGPLVNGSLFWYKLEEIDSSGNIVAAYYPSPASVIVGGTRTPTATATTPVNTGPNPTATPITPLPTVTPIPTQAAMATSSPVSSVLPNLPTSLPGTINPYPGTQPGQEGVPPAGAAPGAEMATPGPSPTWEPFPSVTIEFPVQEENLDLPSFSPPIKQEEILRLWPVGILVLFWVGIGAWYYFSHRHLE
jgi:hypothetical protein